MGSDDYIAKPFLPMELVIRTRKLLTRIYENNKISKTINKLINNTYTIDFDKRMIFEDNKRIDITSKEFNFLSIMINNKNIALSREDIISKIYGEDYFGTDRTIDDLVRRIRKKLPELRIETIYGYGYRWCESED